MNKYSLNELQEIIEHEKYLRKENQELYEENQQLKKQKDDVVEYVKNYIAFRKEFDLDKLLRMLGEIE